MKYYFELHIVGTARWSVSLSFTKEVAGIQATLPGVQMSGCTFILAPLLGYANNVLKNHQIIKFTTQM